MSDVESTAAARGGAVGTSAVGRGQSTTHQAIVFTNLVVTSIATVNAIWRGIVYGFQPAELALFLVFYFLTMLGITLGFHRLFSHVSFKAKKWFRGLLAVLAMMGTQGPLFTWVADHRRHHGLSDREGDTHSPNLWGRNFKGQARGFWHAHIGWMFTNDPTSWARYIPDLMKDRQLYWLHRYYFVWALLSLLLPALAGWLLMGGEGAWSGLLWGGLVRIFATSHVVLGIGSLGHMFGSQPFRERTQDYSANNFWISFASLGECNQSNHHAFPASARHGVRWWEPDFNYSLLRLLHRLGLVWDVKQPPKWAFERENEIAGRGGAQPA